MEEGAAGTPRGPVKRTLGQRQQQQAAGHRGGERVAGRVSKGESKGQGQVHEHAHGARAGKAAVAITCCSSARALAGCVAFPAGVGRQGPRPVPPR